MKLSRTFILLITFFISINCFATTAKYKGQNYNIEVIYNDIITPGDPIFAKASFITSNKIEYISANLYLLTNDTEETIRQSEFYLIQQKNEKRKNYFTLFCGVPSSTYLKENEYKIKIEYSLNDTEQNSFSLPLSFNHKDFIKEELNLDQKNSDIKNNFSKERMAQIEKLNNILDTHNYSDYINTTLPKFSEPLVCNRRTSFFGDRRVYNYIDGKSSTNLHYGVDYGVKTGTDVFSCAKGKVVLAEFRISTGWSICIEHLPGLYSLYYHLDSLNVHEGDIVNNETNLGKSGCTGLATGPHLHWEMRLNMEALNPDFFVEQFSIFLQ